MRRFPEHLVGANRAIWVAMAGRPFVLGLAHGTLPAVALRSWVQQDRIFVLEERRSPLPRCRSSPPPSPRSGNSAWPLPR
jgi:thiaminase